MRKSFIVPVLLVLCFLGGSAGLVFHFVDAARALLPASLQEQIWGEVLAEPMRGAEHELDDFGNLVAETPDGAASPDADAAAPSTTDEPTESASSDAGDGEDSAGQPDSDIAADEGDPAPEPGPVVYEEDPRYTVELVPDRGEVFRSEVQSGDRAEKLLAPWLDNGDFQALLEAANPVYQLTRIRVGRPFSVVRDPETQRFREFKYEFSKDERLVVERGADGFTARKEKIDYETRLERLSGRIETNLSEAVTTGMNESIGLAIALADVFASEINFISDPRVGDTFELLVEKRYRNGTFADYGRLIGARYVNDGKLHQAYLFHDASGRAAYYNAKGESLHRALLKAPLSFLRVTSRYTMARRHPVHGSVRPHQGIDYGAPSGTPIMAVGAGVITKAGRAGGYGNQVIIRHGGGLESLYGHMLRFAKGIRAGVKVRQSQTIGYVGSTGVSTGPHLDFRIRQRGAFVNPDKLVVPRDEGIGSRQRAAFKTLVNDVDAFWKGTRELTTYDPDAWLEKDTGQ